MINCCEHVTLSVSAVGSGQLFYQWKKDGKPIDCNKPTLTIPFFRCKHQGDYTCEARDSQETVESRPAKLKLSKYVSL